jgi:hypothetical protein
MLRETTPMGKKNKDNGPGCTPQDRLCLWSGAVKRSRKVSKRGRATLEDRRPPSSGAEASTSFFFFSRINLIWPGKVAIDEVEYK